MVFGLAHDALQLIPRDTCHLPSATSGTRYRERKRVKADTMKVLGANQLASLSVEVPVIVAAQDSAQPVNAAPLDSSASVTVTPLDS
ncbi:hypothetical protein CQW23_03778 [Capsicum baccatum]|uniref:Uncharacterized protein n=1 Tax=Capsicum baccatum TaxID=33114 RepID=A0A2G2XCQ8_CAPBA|nr:hypothetical protein CQW23_03778 [Capsicum baccatum]